MWLQPVSRRREGKLVGLSALDSLKNVPGIAGKTFEKFAGIYEAGQGAKKKGTGIKLAGDERLLLDQLLAQLPTCPILTGRKH